MCHVIPSSIITIHCWPKRMYLCLMFPYSYAQSIWAYSMTCFLLLCHIHMPLYCRFLLVHHGCLSMQHACLLIPHGSWAGTIIAYCSSKGNSVLCILYVSLHFMVICFYSLIAPVFSCTMSVYSKMIACNLMPLVCLSVHHSQMLNRLVWLLIHLIV